MWTDADTLGLVKAGIDNARQTGEIARKGGRTEAAAKADAEAAVLAAYMPSQMDEAEIESFLRGKAAEGMTKMGDLMAALRAECPGRYDGKLASNVARRVIG